MLQSLLRAAAALLDADATALIARDGRILPRDDPARSIGLAEAAARSRTDFVSAVAATAIY
ncbi:MAG TPA: hypothetical protein VND80_06705 [Steroidobacteraceae bacterium]|nr:hypothetical protein [Steroidobacteraceae bacterium]